MKFSIWKIFAIAFFISIAGCSALDAMGGAPGHRGMAMPSQAEAEGRTMGFEMKKEGVGVEAAVAGAPVYVRRYFPETMYFVPEVAVDPDGNGEITVPLADSITTWRIDAHASNRKGESARVSHGLKVFQEFFLDMDLPLSLTQGDTISLPVQVYNYLKTAQEVSLRMEKGNWFDLKDSDLKKINLQPGEVKSLSFTIQVQKRGYFPLRVYGKSGNIEDAVEKYIEVQPNGKKWEESRSGELAYERKEEILFPPSTIEGTPRVEVKIFPILLTQVLTGLEGMIQMPYG